MESTILGKVAKNDKGDFIVVSRTTMKNATGIDIRNFYTSEDGELSPTKKGININSELICDVIKLVVDNLTADEMEDLYDILGDKMNSYIGNDCGGDCEPEIE